MKVTVFVKRCQTKDGKRFYVYVANLERKDGTKQYVTVRFPEERKPDPERCPLIIEVPKDKANLSVKHGHSTDKETGEVREWSNYTLWVKDFSYSDEEYVDHSLDDFA